MNQLFQLYDKFLSLFPDAWHTWVSLGLLIIMVMLVWRYLKVGIIGIILLVLFVPASVPILRQIATALFEFATQLMNRT